MKHRSNIFLILAHAFLGVGCFFLYVQHVRSVYEAKYNSGHIKGPGREFLLRNEDALYYSFYKTIAGDVSFTSGYQKLLNVTSIEYPNSLNVVHHFHVLPEIFIGYMYHGLNTLTKELRLPTVSCWAETGTVNEFVMTCDGVGDPLNFYVEFVWFLGGLTVFILYMYSSFLSGTCFGGIYAAMLYIIFHKFAAKIYEKPVARENFAFPFIFWQIFYVTLCIDRASKIPSSKYQLISRLSMIIKLTFITTISLLCWQFSSIIYAAQILIMLIPQNLPLSLSLFCIDYVISHFLSNLLAFYFTYGNKKYFLSWQNGPAVALLFYSVANIWRIRRKSENSSPPVKYSALGFILALSMQGTITDILEKSGYSHPNENPFTIYRDLILYWTLQRKINFTSTLLACSQDLKEINLTELWGLLKTSIIKPLCLYGVVTAAQLLRRWRLKIDSNPQDNVQRVINYVLEDFIEENKLTMNKISQKETQHNFNLCLESLKNCEYDYERYKEEKNKAKLDTSSEHKDFINDVKKLKNEINREEQRKAKLKCEASTSENQDSKNEEASNDGSTNEREPLLSLLKQKSDTVQITCNSLPEVNYSYVYSVAQFVMFLGMGVALKKLFFLCFTLGCVISPTLSSTFWLRKHKLFLAGSILIFMSSIIDPGVQNFEKEYLPDVPANNDIELLLEWINLNTEKDAVFGGPIEIIGTVHLTTRRPIVNHPFLDVKDISERTEAIYSTFSRQQSSDIYNKCSQLKVQYLIISFDTCSKSSEDECDLLSIWDEMQPSYRKHPQLCSDLLHKNIPSFIKVFSNEHYGIVKLFSQSVQLNLRHKNMPEKII